MREAKAAGFWLVQLYVKVSLRVCLERNARRERSVPEEVLCRYMSEIEGAVKAVRTHEDLIDELIEVDNEREDEHTSENERWGRHYEYVREVSRRHGAMFDGMDPWTHSMSVW